MLTDELLKFADEEGHALLLARVEISLAASRDPDLRAIADELAASAREPVEFFLQLLAVDLDRAKAETCLGLLDGLMLIYVTGQGPRPTAAQIEQLFRAAIS